MRQSVTQVAQLVGFAVGGVVATTTSPQICLVVDASSFGLSALLISGSISYRPAPGAALKRPSIFSGAHIVWFNPARRAIFLSTMLGLFLVAPHGVIVPYVSELGVATAWVGFILAGSGGFAVIGLAAFARFLPTARHEKAFPLAGVFAGVPLVLVTAHGGVFVSIVAFGLSCAVWTVQVALAVSLLAELLPEDQRAQGMGVAAAMNLTAQGMGTAATATVAELTSPTTALALAGVGATLFACWPAYLWSRRVAAAPDERPAEGFGT